MKKTPARRSAVQSPGNWLFTSESVSEGHPDKLADRISDEILDEALRRNPKARVAVETMVTAGRCILAGERSGVSGLDYDALARRAMRDVGYVGGDFDADTEPIEVLVHEQSAEIAAAAGPPPPRRRCQPHPPQLRVDPLTAAGGSDLGRRRRGPDQGRPIGRLRRALAREERGGQRISDRCQVQLAYAIGVAELA